MTREQVLSIVRNHSKDGAELPDNIAELYIAVFGIPEFDVTQKTAWSELCAAAKEKSTVQAIWDESQEVYRIGASGHSLVSADGDQWYINIVGGEYAEGGIFDVAEIVLTGGPRDGTSVG